MEDWIRVLKEKLSDDRIELPDNAWELFEANYLAPKKRSKAFSIIIAATAITAAALASIVFLRHAEDNVMTPLESPVSPSELLADTYSTKKINDEDPRPIKEVVIRSKMNQGKESYKEDLIVPSPVLSEDSAVTSIDSVYFRQEVKEYTAYSKVFLDDFEHSSRRTSKRLTFTPYFSGMKNSSSAKLSPSAFTDSKLTSAYHRTFLEREISYNNIPFDNASDYNAITANHSIPFSFGVNVGYSLNPYLSIVSGIESSIYLSSFSNVFENTSASQRALYLGVPLRLEWNIWHDSPFSLILGAGGKVDRLIYGTIGENRLKDNSLNWSVTSCAGIRYCLIDNVAIYIAPEISWFFKPDNPAILTYRTENPFMVSINAGLSFRL